MLMPTKSGHKTSELVDHKVLLQSLKKRYKSAKGIADQWESILEACFYYAIPFRNKFNENNDESEGAMKNAQIIDTTSVEATKAFVSKIHETMTPPQAQWGNLMVDETSASANGWSDDDIEMAQDILNNYCRRLFNYVKGSNFDVSVNECYYDLAIGTSCLVINSNTDEKPFLCTSIPLDKLAIEEAANGKIESWFRSWDNLKIGELSVRWRNIVLSQALLADVKSDPDAKVKKLYEGTAYFPQLSKPYAYCVWTDEDVLLCEYKTTNPGIVWRFQKTNNETWGRGPVMEALPSMISLNQIAKIEMAAANLNTFKPFMAFGDGVMNPHTFQLKPLSVIPIAPIGSGGQVPLIPLPGTADPQFSQLLIGDLRLQIKALLFAEQATDGKGLQPETAFELSLKSQTLAEKIGPLFSRVQQEFLEPTFYRFQDILHERGLLMKPELEGIPISFVYQSPLALSKGQEEVARFSQFMQVLQGIMGPDASQVFINNENTPYLIQEMLQVDERFLNNIKGVKQTMQDARKDQQLQQLADASGSQTQPATNPIEQPIQG